MSGLLSDRKWISLESRRRIGRMNFIRKMIRNDVTARVDDFFIKKESSTRSKNKYSLFRSRANNNVVAGSFFYHSINDWNKIPNHFIDPLSSSEFTNKLHHHYLMEELGSRS